MRPKNGAYGGRRARGQMGNGGDGTLTPGADALGYVDFFIMVAIAVFVYDPLFFRTQIDRLWQPDATVELAKKIEGVDSALTPNRMRGAAPVTDRVEFLRERAFYGVSIGKMLWLWWVVVHTAVVVGWAYFTFTFRTRDLTPKYSAQQRTNDQFLVNVMVFISVFCEKGLPGLLEYFDDRNRYVFPFIAVTVNFLLCTATAVIIAVVHAWVFFGLWLTMPISMFGMFFVVRSLSQMPKRESH